MEYDAEKAKEKTQELIEIAKSALLKYCHSHVLQASEQEALEGARCIVSNFVRVEPPEKEPQFFEFITMTEGGRGGGRSVKPGNLFLNVRKLMTNIASSVLTITGTIALPWAAPFAALVIWNNVWSTLSVELSEREAAVLWTMWVDRDKDNCIPDAGLLERVNRELNINGRSVISQQELDDALDVLKKMGCIKRSAVDSKKWWLREWVRVSYK